MNDQGPNINGIPVHFSILEANFSKYMALKSMLDDLKSLWDREDFEEFYKRKEDLVLGQWIGEQEKSIKNKLDRLSREIEQKYEYQPGKLVSLEVAPDETR